MNGSPESLPQVMSCVWEAVTWTFQSNLVIEFVGYCLRGTRKWEGHWVRDTSLTWTFHPSLITSNYFQLLPIASNYFQLLPITFMPVANSAYMIMRVLFSCLIQFVEFTNCCGIVYTWSYAWHPLSRILCVTYEHHLNFTSSMSQQNITRLKDPSTSSASHMWTMCHFKFTNSTTPSYLVRHIWEWCVISDS